MTVSELIAALSKMPADSNVTIFDDFYWLVEGVSVAQGKDLGRRDDLVVIWHSERPPD